MLNKYDVIRLIVAVLGLTAVCVSTSNLTPISNEQADTNVISYFSQR